MQEKSKAQTTACDKIAQRCRPKTRLRDARREGTSLAVIIQDFEVGRPCWKEKWAQHWAERKRICLPRRKGEEHQHRSR